ncbi:MAG: photosynthetic complex putative assembly protein PuhB [Myxococcales bacterium]|nr:photosynthetic complex putative assembly protein PuhB [Myxococcales bacterium]
MSDIDIEQIPGIPGTLPPGEFVIWQGRPQWRAIARHVFKLPWVAGWLGLFASIRVGLELSSGAGILGSAFAIGLTALCLGILVATSVGFARSTIYTITSRRIVFRIGVAVPMSVNVPFHIIAAANLRVPSANGTGDIELELSGPNRIAWLNLWPHVGGGQFARPRPTLKCLADAQQVASVLREAVAAWAKLEGRRLSTTASGAEVPNSSPMPTAVQA